MILHSYLKNKFYLICALTLRRKFFKISVRTVLFTHLFILLALSAACKRNPLDVNISRIELDINIERFEKELFNINTESIAESVAALNLKYNDFLDIFSFHVISIGLPSEKEYYSYLGTFLSDPLNKEVYEATLKEYPDLKNLEDIFTKAFKRYKVHFPENEIPEMVSYISRFNYPNFTVGNYIGIGLDMYLGEENEYYIRMGLPQYQRQNMYREKIPSDIIYTFGSNVIPYNDSLDNILSRIIHQGKIMYFMDALLPDQADSLKIGFSSEQLKWCENNERQMWEYLIEHKLLFSSDPMVIKKITGPAPFTYYFTGESPGRTGIWIGWQILREYAKKNKDLSLADILDEMDYQKILRGSAYNP